MLTAEELQALNTSLLMKYGRKFDKAKYNLAWTTGYFEKRYVEGTEFIGNIKLRDVKGIKTMPKYPRDQNKWVLEIISEVPESLRHELVEPISYEPVYIFHKKEVEPNWNMIDFLAYCSHNPIEEVLSPESEAYKRNKKDYDECMMILEDALPELAVKMKRGSAAFFDATKNAYLIN